MVLQFLLEFLSLKFLLDLQTPFRFEDFRLKFQPQFQLQFPSIAIIFSKRRRMLCIHLSGSPLSARYASPCKATEIAVRNALDCPNDKTKSDDQNLFLIKLSFYSNLMKLMNQLSFCLRRVMPAIIHARASDSKTEGIFDNSFRKRKFKRF